MKIKKPKVSIIMNCHNGETFLKKSVLGIINQTYKNWELIFFDNKSKDRSIDVVKRFQDKRIKIFKSKKYLKLYDARNLAIKKAKGNYLAFCDTDDWWIKKKLQEQIKQIKNKKISLVFSNVYIYDQKKKTKKLYFKNFVPSGQITQFLLNDYKLGIVSVLMSRKIFYKKKFDKRYEIIGDFDFFLNLSLEENFYCEQKPLAFYRHHEKNFSKKTNIFVKEMNFWLAKNSKKFKKLNYSLKGLKLNYYKLKLKKFISWGL